MGFRIPKAISGSRFQLTPRLLDARSILTLGWRWRAVATGKAETVPRITIKVKGGMPMRLERRR